MSSPGASPQASVHLWLEWPRRFCQAFDLTNTPDDFLGYARRATRFVYSLLARLGAGPTTRTEDSVSDSPANEILNMPLPDMIRDMGLAVAKANKELAKSQRDETDSPQGNVVYTIPRATLELSVALTVSKGRDFTVEGGGNLGAFALNASYTNTYGFSESASSKIKVELRAREPEQPSDAG